MKIGYGKIGRSMPLTLERCGNLGGDVEMVAIVKELALRHPDDEFVLLGRNSGERPGDVGLPENVTNPWHHWGGELRRRINLANLNTPLTIERQLTLRDIFAELTLPTFLEMDALVFWLGQHGTTNSPIPSLMQPGQLTKPFDWCAYYASFIFQGINAWRDVDPLKREEIYLNADARNWPKMRDLKWPLQHPVIGQRNEIRNIKHERYGAGATGFVEMKERLPGIRLSRDVGPNLWEAKTRTIYGRLEINGLLPGTPFGDLISYDENFYGRSRFGMFINEARAIGIRPTLTRRYIMDHWVLPLQPAWVHGTWSAASQLALGLKITPAPWSEYYPRLHSVLCTFTTPSSGSGWATAKPWEAFAAGTVCFFHPDYDDQDNILGDAPPELRSWLRVPSPEDLKIRIDRLVRDPVLWQRLIRMQREHFDRALAEREYMQWIETRIYGGSRA